MAPNKHVLHSFHHLVLGVALGLKGFDKLSHHALIGGVILCFAAVVLAYFAFMAFSHRQHRLMNILIHLFEVLVSCFMAYIFFHEGKKYLPLVFAVAGVGFFIAAVIASAKLKKGPSGHGG